jgi:magnesium-transporting ATPase (P-type)
MPSKARIVRDGRERFVSVEALAPGAIFRVKSGERVAADGVVVEGRSHADQGVLTGESVPAAQPHPGGRRHGALQPLGDRQFAGAGLKPGALDRRHLPSHRDALRPCYGIVPITCTSARFR